MKIQQIKYYHLNKYFYLRYQFQTDGGEYVFCSMCKMSEEATPIVHFKLNDN